MRTQGSGDIRHARDEIAPGYDAFGSHVARAWARRRHTRAGFRSAMSLLRRPAFSRAVQDLGSFTHLRKGAQMLRTSLLIGAAIAVLIGIAVALGFGPDLLNFALIDGHKHP